MSAHPQPGRCNWTVGARCSSTAYASRSLDLRIVWTRLRTTGPVARTSAASPALEWPAAPAGAWMPSSRPWQPSRAQPAGTAAIGRGRSESGPATAFGSRTCRRSLRAARLFGTRHSPCRCCGGRVASRRRRSRTSCWPLWLWSWPQLLLLCWLILFLVTANRRGRGPESRSGQAAWRAAGRTVAFGLLDTLLLVALAVPIGPCPGYLEWRPWRSPLSTRDPRRGDQRCLAGCRRRGRGRGSRGRARGVAHAARARGEAVAAGHPPGQGPLLVIDAIVVLARWPVLFALIGGGVIGSSGPNVLALVAPGLVVLACALLGSRALPGLCRAAYGPTRRRGQLGRFLAVRQLGRRPSTLRLALVLAVAFGLSRSGSTRGRSRVATPTTGHGPRPVPRRSYRQPGAGPRLAAIVDALDPSGREATVVSTTSDFSGSGVRSSCSRSSRTGSPASRSGAPTRPGTTGHTHPTPHPEGRPRGVPVRRRPACEPGNLTARRFRGRPCSSRTSPDRRRRTSTNPSARSAAGGRHCAGPFGVKRWVSVASGAWPEVGAQNATRAKPVRSTREQPGPTPRAAEVARRPDRRAFAPEGSRRRRCRQVAARRRVTVRTCAASGLGPCPVVVVAYSRRTTRRPRTRPSPKATARPAPASRLLGLDPAGETARKPPSWPRRRVGPSPHGTGPQRPRPEQGARQHDESRGGPGPDVGASSR